jgi:hypothetical protein
VETVRPNAELQRLVSTLFHLYVQATTRTRPSFEKLCLVTQSNFFFIHVIKARKRSPCTTFSHSILGYAIYFLSPYFMAIHCFSNFSESQGTLAQIWTGHYKLQTVAAPRISRQSAHKCSKDISPTYRLPLRPRRHPWYSILLAAESTPMLFCGRRDYFNEKSQ